MIVLHSPNRSFNNLCVRGIFLVIFGSSLTGLLTRNTYTLLHYTSLRVSTHAFIRALNRTNTFLLDMITLSQFMRVKTLISRVDNSAIATTLLIFCCTNSTKGCLTDDSPSFHPPPSTINTLKSEFIFRFRHPINPEIGIAYSSIPLEL